MSNKSLASVKWKIGVIIWWYFLNRVAKLVLLKMPFWIVLSFLMSSQIFLNCSADSIW